MERKNSLRENVSIRSLVSLLIFFCQSNCNAFHQNSVSVVHSNANSVDRLHFLLPPDHLYDNFPLHVEYVCTQKSFVHVDVRVWTESQDGWVIFRGRLKCRTEDVHSVQQRVVRIRLPRYIAYRPGRRNRFGVFVERRARIEMWMTRTLGFFPRRRIIPMNGIVAKEEVDVIVDFPFDRPDRPRNRCPSWLEAIEEMLPYVPQCPVELEVFHLLKYPLALSGSKTGLHVNLPSYKSRILQHWKADSKRRLQFTYVFWIYVMDYCSTAEFCSLMHHITWDDQISTPLFHINRKGQVQVEFVSESGHISAFLTPSSFFIPKFQWVRLMISANAEKPWNLYLNYGPQFELKAATQIILSTQRPSYDDTFGVFVVGGSEIFNSFTGYVGEATVYRRKSLAPHQVSLPVPSHPLFLLPLDDMRKECLQHIGDVNSMIFHYKTLLNKIFKHRSCPNHLPFTLVSSVETSCQPSHSSRDQYDDLLKHLVRHKVLEGTELSLEDIGKEIYAKATEFLEEDVGSNDFSDIKSLQGLLQLAACLGSEKASFLLSVILNHGLATPVNETQARLHLMAGVLAHHRLSLLSLANKYVFGLDGFPVSMEHAYVYYKEVADATRADLESPDSSEGLTETVRLTSETDISSQTGETEDLFMWLKHQASQGVTTAQRNIARMFYWGVQGIKKNVAAAAEYYKMSASSGDPIALYDYGIIQLKGHGTKKNLTGAVESLTAAAQLYHPEALNTLGWHALEIEKNYTKAADYFEKAHGRGNKDATYNLAHMYLHGNYPGSGVNRDKAFELITKAAAQGQLEAGIMFAMYVTRGHPKIGRDVNLAMQWARYIAEQNPSVGKILSSGVRAFRKQLWKNSVIYYLMAASSGVEVANFNLAFLCDENYGNVASFLEKECKWRHFNLSAQRPFRDVSPYAWIKLAEYNYYGALNKNPNHDAAAEMYSQAALAGDPQGLFSLASLVEEDIIVSPSVWKKLNIRKQTYEDNSKLLLHLYSRCRESFKREAFLPCTMALYRFKALQLYQQYQLVGMAFLVLLVTALILTAGIRLYRVLSNDTPAVAEEHS